MICVKHMLDEELAIRLLGWKWMSFIGTPVKSSPAYPNLVRVRQLMSPKQLESKSWINYFNRTEGREATGDEPLAYTYCSSWCTAASIPKFTILVEVESE